MTKEIYYSRCQDGFPPGAVLKKCSAGDPHPRSGDWLGWGNNPFGPFNNTAFLVSETASDKVFYDLGWDSLLRSYHVWIVRKPCCWKRRQHD